MTKVNVKALQPFSHGNVDAAEGGVYEVNKADAHELEKAGFVSLESDGKAEQTQVDQPAQVAQPGDVVADNGAEMLGASQKMDAPLENKSRKSKQSEA